MSYKENLEDAFNSIQDLTRVLQGSLLVVSPNPYAEKAESSLEYLRGYIKGQEEIINSLIEKVT